jgi:hypothetical protein
MNRLALDSKKYLSLMVAFGVILISAILSQWLTAITGIFTILVGAIVSLELGYLGANVIAQKLGTSTLPIDPAQPPKEDK